MVCQSVFQSQIEIYLVFCRTKIWVGPWYVKVKGTDNITDKPVLKGHIWNKVKLFL